jgi:hypothetical protein
MLPAKRPLKSLLHPNMLLLLLQLVLQLLLQLLLLTLTNTPLLI